MEDRKRGVVPPTEERFTRIYEAHFPAVLAYCARRVSRSDAEEVAHEVFVTLWRVINGFDEGSPLPWLYQVAFGAIRNRWKTDSRAARLRLRLSGLAAESADSPDMTVVRGERDRVVLAALESLKPDDQELLRLSVWEELSAPEIATVMGCSLVAAEQRLHRARQRLARVLSPELDMARSPKSAEPGGSHE